MEEIEESMQSKSNKNKSIKSNISNEYGDDFESVSG